MVQSVVKFVVTMIVIAIGLIVVSIPLYAFSLMTIWGQVSFVVGTAIIAACWTVIRTK